jgi:DMSO/TMAO reductase YedYZ molybdopterin-dependent catalytic subunit
MNFYFTSNPLSPILLVQTGERGMKGKNPGDLPVGQHWIKKWPVRTAELPPDVDPESWTLEIRGLVERPLTLTLQEIQGLEAVELARDFHCVESWSVPDNKWKGVRVHRILELANPLPEARYALVCSPGGFETSLTLQALLRPDTLLVWERNGEPLTWDHGYPLRLIVPDLYAYKSVKWVSEIRLLHEDRPGTWEKQGYHRGANVWSGERFEGD